MKTQDRQSLVARPFYGTNTQGLRRLRFPFFKSQCQRAGGREAKCHTPEPPMEANPPSGVNDSRSVPREDPSKPRLCPKGSRGRV
jgi:hypothetical protein